jgi:hypothetical protein
MFPVRYGLNFYINLLRNSVFKGLTGVCTVDAAIYQASRPITVQNGRNSGLLHRDGIS